MPAKRGQKGRPIDRPDLSVRMRFPAEYLKDFNGAEAAVRAGATPNKRSAGVLASRWLRDPEVIKEIDRLVKARAKRVQVDADTVLRELLHMATVDVSGAFDEDNCLLPIREIPEEVRRAIASVEVDEIWEWQGEGKERKRVQIGVTKKIKFWDKPGSNVALGRHLKLFSDKLEVTVKGKLADRLAAARKRLAAR